MFAHVNEFISASPLNFFFFNVYLNIPATYAGNLAIMKLILLAS